MSASSDYQRILLESEAQKANALAGAQRANAQLWGGAVSNIGQYLSQIPQQQLEMQRAKQQAAVTQMQLDRAQRQIKGEDAVNQITANLLKDNGDGSTLIDTQKLSQLMGAQNVPLEQQSTALKWADDMNGTVSKFNQIKIDHQADFANSLLKNLNDGESLDPTVFHGAVALAQANKMITPEQTKQLTDAVDQGADPIQLLKRVRDLSEKYKPKYQALPEGAGVLDVSSGQVTTPATGKKPKTFAELYQDANDLKSPTHEASQAALDAYIKSRPQAQGRETFEEWQQKYDYERQHPKPGTASGATVVVQTLDENGKPVTKIVPKVAGATYERPPSATTQTRVDSAIAVNQTGNKIIEKLTDPTYAAVVGPVMGRYNSIQDWLGNPPPELSELAGLIESYSLANMGVHGMRSAQGAEQIKHLLEAKHTPQSLIAAVKGLQEFSDNFIKNQGRDVPTPKPATPKVNPFRK